MYWLTKAIRNSESLTLSLKTSAHRRLHWVSEYQPWLPLAKNIYFEQVLWVIVSSADILACDNCPLILPILLKWKIKNFLLITFQVLLCVVNLRSTEPDRMHRTLNRLNGLSSWWNNPVVVKNYVFVDILYSLTFWFLYLYPAIVYLYWVHYRWRKILWENYTL